MLDNTILQPASQPALRACKPSATRCGGQRGAVSRRLRESTFVLKFDNLLWKLTRECCSPSRVRSRCDVRGTKNLVMLVHFRFRYMFLFIDLCPVFDKGTRNKIKIVFSFFFFLFFFFFPPPRLRFPRCWSPSRLSVCSTTCAWCANGRAPCGKSKRYEGGDMTESSFACRS
ncbi:hypothetical protein LX32DRAFT_110446 [Colletotrichum zoysiae]|uniref:Uncharacterized protein n=1 Tax=Colletotrichum zoysiae TaxID=1216348 RepID=A0AAD9HAC0_9PEZI|nr:hypothetical protein LX32DRAFT_110446 [Colletotrichum zoysiae]